jgi:hypothetical protein
MNKDIINLINTYQRDAEWTQYNNLISLCVEQSGHFLIRRSC